MQRGKGWSVPYCSLSPDIPNRLKGVAFVATFQALRNGRVAVANTDYLVDSIYIVTYLYYMSTFVRRV